MTGKHHGLVSGILEVQTISPTSRGSTLTSLSDHLPPQSSAPHPVSRLCLRTPQLTHAATAIASAAARSRLISTTSAATFYATPMLCAEPLKKKKRIDPSVIKAREERRRKKLEKQIRRLEKNARQLKPIDEMEVPLVLIDERA